MTFINKVAAGLAALTTMAGTAALADYPSKPIKIMVGFSAGGGTDTTARGFASYMHEAPSMNGMPAYIVNLPGASGQKAAKQVLEEDRDGHTLYMINIGTFIAGELAKGEDRPYHVPDDFVNLGCASQLVTSLQVHASNSATTMQEFIDNAKASGEEITWGTSGAATMHATIGHIFFDANGIKHKKVPFKGGSKARAALVSQSVDAVFGGVNTVVGFEDDIRALASAGAAPLRRGGGAAALSAHGELLIPHRLGALHQPLDAGRGHTQAGGPQVAFKGFTGHLGQAALAADFLHQAHAGGL